MKKILVSMVVLGVCLFAIGSGAEDKPKKVMNFLAVMDLKCDRSINKDQCGALTDVVIDELVKTKKYTVIDRANRDKILGEAGFQQTGCVDERCTIEAGRILGVGKIVVGKITKLGETYLVVLQLLNVETAAVETSAKETCKKCKIDDLIGTVTNAARKLMGQAPMPATPTTSSPPNPTPTISPEPKYKVAYRKAMALYEAGLYKTARGSFAKFLKEFPSSNLADNALFWIGECYYSEKDYINAAKSYARVFKEYPYENRVPDAYYRLGLTFWHLGKKESAIASLRKVLNDYPKSYVAPLARRKLQAILSEAP